MLAEQIKKRMKVIRKMNPEVLIVDGRARLAHHFVNRRMRRVGVIPRAGEHCRHVRVDVFVIRQIDIHRALQHAQRLHAFIAAAVVDDRDVRPVQRQRVEHGGNEVRRRHEVDVVRALRLQLAEDLRKPLRRDDLPLAPLADAFILAEHAPQPAAGKEHRAAAARAADAGLLPPVQRRARDFGQRAHAANARAALRRALRAAVSGAKRADHRSINASNRGRMPMPSGKWAANCGMAWLGKELPSMNTGPSGVIATSQATKRTCGTTCIAFRHIALTSSQ